MSDQLNTTEPKDLAPETQDKVELLTRKGLVFVARVGEETAQYLRQHHLSTAYALDSVLPELPSEGFDYGVITWAQAQHPLYLFSSLQMFEVDGQYILMAHNLGCPYNALTLSKINIMLPVLNQFVVSRFAELPMDRFQQWVRDCTGLTDDEALAIVGQALRS